MRKFKKKKEMNKWIRKKTNFTHFCLWHENKFLLFCGKDCKCEVDSTKGFVNFSLNKEEKKLEETNFLFSIQLN